MDTPVRGTISARSQRRGFALTFSNQDLALGLRTDLVDPLAQPRGLSRNVLRSRGHRSRAGVVRLLRVGSIGLEARLRWGFIFPHGPASKRIFSLDEPKAARIV